MNTKDYELIEIDGCKVNKGQGPVAQNLHLSAHLSRSLKNPLWVHLRVLHGTHLALS